MHQSLLSGLTKINEILLTSESETNASDLILRQCNAHPIVTPKLYNLRTRSTKKHQCTSFTVDEEPSHKPSQKNQFHPTVRNAYR